jgi:CheY-like chemotaxis protein
MDTTSKSYILLQFPSCRALARYRSISLENHDKANVKIPLVRQQTSALSFGTEIRGEYENQKKMKRQNIMIVDDEDDINLLFAMVLCGEGYNVDAFTDPVAAIMKFERGSYDLLIIDILLPKMDGFELYERIKQLDKNVKVCFLTAGEINYDQFKKAASFPEIITEDCFIKIPVENKTLVRKVKNILSFNLN